ncbi:MAG: hypothetical protein U1E78_13220 [Gammaproteobacteria bacterium]
MSHTPQNLNPENHQVLFFRVPAYALTSYGPTGNPENSAVKGILSFQ